jgi:large subunit ribosomal protein L10
MKKIGLIVKETSENRIKNTFKESSGVFIIKYSGLCGADLNLLRMNLRGSNSSMLVVKNSVARRALKSVGQEGLIGSVEGPCAMVFVKDEPVAISKVLFDFVKEHEPLKIEKGFLFDKIIEKKDIESMSKLPSRDMLRAQVVGALNAPIFGLVFTLNQVLAKFVYCLEEIKKTKKS